MKIRIKAYKHKGAGEEGGGGGGSGYLSKIMISFMKSSLQSDHLRNKMFKRP